VLSYNKTEPTACESNALTFQSNFVSPSLLLKQATSCAFFFTTKSLLECRCYLFSRQLNLFLHLKKGAFKLFPQIKSHFLSIALFIK
jgi:hypothetical protein